MNDNTPETEFKVIKTARSEKAINEAVEQGYKPIIKPVVRSPKISSKFAIIREKATGKITVISDYRAKGYNVTPNQHSDFENVIDFTSYYPYHFESPFAAYLIPKDIQIDEEVWVEDVIADIVGNSWNQGDTYRLNSSLAIWTGHDLEICFNSQTDLMTAIG